MDNSFRGQQAAPCAALPASRCHCRGRALWSGIGRLGRSDRLSQRRVPAGPPVAPWLALVIAGEAGRALSRRKPTLTEWPVLLRGRWSGQASLALRGAAWRPAQPPAGSAWWSPRAFLKAKQAALAQSLALSEVPAPLNRTRHISSRTDAPPAPSLPFHRSLCPC